MDRVQLVRLIFASAVFVAVTALGVGLLILIRISQTRQEEKVQRRLGIGGGSGEEKVLRLWHPGGVAETTVPRGTKPSMLQRLEHLRLDAGWHAPMPRILFMVALITAAAAVVLLMVTKNVLLVAVTPVLVILLFNGVLQYRIGKRTELFERQLVDALSLAARSLRAGHPLSGAFRLISEEIPEPVGTIFGQISEQEALGVGIQDALEQSAAESRNADMKIFAASVAIQLRSGGNLAEMMERVTWVIRERMRLNRRVRVLTAEVQLSKWVLLSLPIGLFVFLSAFRPEYMEPMYTTTAGRVMLVIGAVSLAVGTWVMNRMSVLKY